MQLARNGYIGGGDLAFARKYRIKREDGKHLEAFVTPAPAKCADDS